MKKLSRFLSLTITIFTGSFIHSMWIAKTDDWKIHLTVILLSISLKSITEKNELE